MNILKKLKKEITNKLKEKPKIEYDNFEMGFDTKYSDNQRELRKTTLKTNCINCGAVLHSDKCEYCGTEYTVDGFGQINEYKVKLNIMGEDKEFYISNIEKHNIYSEAYRNVEGNLVIEKVADKLELKLIEM